MIRPGGANKALKAAVTPCSNEGLVRSSTSSILGAAPSIASLPRRPARSIAIDFAQAPSHSLETADYLAKAKETRERQSQNANPSSAVTIR